MTSKYHRKIATNKEGFSDVYDVLAAFHVTNPAIQHAVKKLLAPGERGGKSYAQDLEEARQSVVRAQEMQPAHLRDEQLVANVDLTDAMKNPRTMVTIDDPFIIRHSGLHPEDKGPWPLPGVQVIKPVAIGDGWTQTRAYSGLPEYASGRRFVKQVPGCPSVAIILETNEGSQAHLWVKGAHAPFLPVKEPLYKGTLGNCFVQADGWLQLATQNGPATDERDPCSTVANVQAAMSEDQA